MDNDTTELIFEVAYFAADERRRINTNVIERALQQVEGLKLESDSSSQERVHTYYNPDTQVGCRFVVFETGSQDEPDRIGLSFEMDLPRASSFALETLPLVVQVARELRANAAVISPDFNDQPAPPTVESLMLRWQEANLDEIDFQEEAGTPIYRFQAFELESLWEYQLLRRELNRRGGSGKAPGWAEAGLWGNPRTLDVVRCSDWTKLSAMAFPDVDWIRLLYPPAPLKHGKVYRLDHLRQVIKFKDQSQPISHWLYEGPRERGETAAAIARLKPVNAAGWLPLSYDQVVDDHGPFPTDPDEDA